MTMDETIDAARIRLAERAKHEGVRILRDNRDNRHYATSTSQPGVLYFVTLMSCTCKGFMAHQRCRHHSALLAAYGALEPDPTPPVCANCGSPHVVYEETRARWIGGARDGAEVATTVHRCGPCQRREGGALDRIAA